MPDFDDNVLETQLRRFIYVGKEKPEYQPGNWFVHNYYSSKQIPSIFELAVNPLKHDTIISTIVEAQNKQLVQNPETLIFLLAVCARQNIHEDLRKKAYNAVKNVCISPENFILFNKFCSQLGKERDPPKNGWGHGWRRVVKEWYLSKTPMELTKIITRCKSRYGWKHKDILILSHIPSCNDEKKLLFNYIINGSKGLEKYIAENPERTEVENEIINYLESINNFKQCEDEHSAAALIETLNLTLDHVPGHLLKSEHVWSALVSKMSLTEILKNIQRIHNMGFLKANSCILAKVLDLITEANVNNEKLHPAEFLIAIKNYENSGKPVSYEKRKIKEQAKKPTPAIPEINKKILEALNKMLYASFTHLQPTNLRYMVTISANKKMMETGSWRCENVNAVEASCLLALSLLHAEKDVTVAIFTPTEVKCVDVDQNVNLLQFMKKLEPLSPEIPDLKQPMAWAEKENKSIDIFINIFHQINKKSDKSEEGIKAYRKKLNLPNAKLVNCATCASTTYDKEAYDRNILSVCGFDAKVPKIIEAFARSYF